MKKFIKSFEKLFSIDYNTLYLYELMNMSNHNRF